MKNLYKKNRHHLNSLKQIDLFRIPIKLRSERSAQSSTWDESVGSFFGMTVTIGIFVIGILYTVEIISQMDDGMLDIFNT